MDDLRITQAMQAAREMAHESRRRAVIWLLFYLALFLVGIMAGQATGWDIWWVGAIALAMLGAYASLRNLGKISQVESQTMAAYRQAWQSDWQGK